MKLPRDIAAADLIRALRVLGYATVRQTGSHIRVKTLRDGEYSETIPCHNPIKVGTLNSILSNIALHHRMTKEALLQLLKLN